MASPQMYHRKIKKRKHLDTIRSLSLPITAA
jgi:hypothetical protein